MLMVPSIFYIAAIYFIYFISPEIKALTLEEIGTLFGGANNVEAHRWYDAEEQREKIAREAFYDSEP